MSEKRCPCNGTGPICPCDFRKLSALAKPAPHLGLPPLERMPLLPPLLPPAPLPLPKDFAIPARMKSEHLAVDVIAASSPVHEMLAKVKAEDERMRRLLPPAPVGMAWTAELQRLEDARDFRFDFSESITYRIVYRLEKRS